MKENLAAVLPERVVSGSVHAQRQSLELAKQVVNACADVKGKDIAVLDVRGVSDISDYFIVVSARSDRQAQGIAVKVLEMLARAGVHPDSIEGLEEAHWVVLDCGDVVLHVFYEPLRAHYDIEGLWMRAKRVSLDALLPSPAASGASL